MRISIINRGGHFFQRLSLLAILAIVLSACSWVDLTQKGVQVDILTKEQAAGCDQLGRTTATIMNKILFMERSKDQQAQELSILARNEAANMGGNGIVPVSDIKDGKQTFVVYRCDSL